MGRRDRALDGRRKTHDLQPGGFMFLRWRFGAIGALVVAVSASAQTFDNIIVFGDSTVDNGFYRSLPNPNNSSSQAQTDAWRAAVATGAGAPTTNPGTVFPDQLAARF